MNLPLPSFGPAHGQGFGESFVARAASPSMVRRAIDRRGLARFVAGTAACALLAAAALFHAWMRTQVTEEGYRLSQVSAENQQLLREREHLTLQAAQLKSPGRIEQLAREKLGMGPAKAEQLVVLAEKKLQVTPRASGTAVARR
jgi:cell division protein FtsL